MLTRGSGPAAASAAASGFSTIAVRYPSDETPADREGAHAVRIDVALRDERVARKEDRPGLRQPPQRGEGVHRIVVVGVQDEEVVSAGERLGGEERVRRAERLRLDREGDGDPPRGARRPR